ncbi:MAG: antibiotic transport system ATP-binding protein [Bacteroidetes bacterium]|nr:MAG: antibiotic transport system ATP-binding protein [Bacteroidota bacterium]
MEYADYDSKKGKYFNPVIVEKVLEVNHLVKHFGAVKAVRDVSFTVYRGDIYGFLGPNGSGKSTTIRMVLNLIRPDSGEVLLFGQQLSHNRREVLSKVGALIERPDFYQYLSAYQNLDILAQYSGIKHKRDKIMELLKVVDLQDRANDKVKTFSQGMKQRLGIAQTLLHDPDLIILDEPVNGLDPQGIKDIREMIVRLNSEMGKTLIVSSHILREMELISNRMIVISKGKVVVEGEVRKLLESDTQQLTLITTDTSKALKLLLEKFPDYTFDRNLLDELHAELPTDVIPSINEALVNAGIGVKQLITRNNLEDFFLQNT